MLMRSVRPPAILRPRWLTTIAWVWGALALVFLIWEGLIYSGLVRWVAEWEFANLGAYYPGATLLVLVLLIASPLMLLAFWARRRQRRDLAAAPFDPRVLLSQMRRFARVFTAVAAGLLGLSATAMLYAFATEPAARTPRLVTLGRDDGGLPASVAAVLRGDVLADRQVTYVSDVILARSLIRLAPIVPAGQRPQVLRFFVQLETPNPPRGAGFSGVLRRGALPGAVATLYRGAGYRVADDAYVLFRDDDQHARPYYTLALQLAWAGLAAGLIAGIQYWRFRRTRRFFGGRAVN